MSGPQSKGARSALWPTLITIPGVLVLLALGIWQVERRAWKWDLIETRTARLGAAAVDLPKAPDLTKMEYRRVRLSGRFLHDREIFLVGRSAKGRLGYHVITPLALAGGGAVLVDRGWVPTKRRDPASRSAGQVAGELSMTGWLRAQPPRNRFKPDNDPAKNFWFEIDLAAMSKYAKLGAARPYYVQAAAPAPPGGLPQPVPISVDLPNNHLQYAITWFLLAVALAVIYAIWMRRRPRG
jgi:surfeit locus 1 family protein